ncbi:AAA family ATPase [uncultured Stenotrophomonas sp.]|uniref:AAA family ATPase n=1 Tax=uncultured Stenotrophomonas sp. TaxID=165438 RepID=UPI0025DB17BA|nr:AAA family ATPase [uncultured Stenotrophomonas sp.]
MFDHDIPINDSGITIVIGENGLGKTIILEATNALFSKNFRYFNGLEFDKFIFEFNDEKPWEITKSNNNGKFTLFISQGIAGRNGKVKLEKLAEISEEDDSRSQRKEVSSRYWLREIEDVNNLLMDEARRGENRGLDDHLKFRILRNLTLNSVYFDRPSAVSPPSWFDRVVENISIRLIETQRIITAKERGSDAYINSVLKSSKELTETIAKIEEEASLIATDLDSTYPTRLVKILNRASEVEPVDLKEKLSELDLQRRYISSAGLIEVTQDQDFLELSGEQRDLMKAMTLYIEDSHRKLDPYRDVARKIELFKGIVNKRFKHKRLDVNKKTGFVFTSKIKKSENGKNQTISPTKLSSGEQNELIIFYQLIFNSRPGNIILIDEPELSLHISWQNQFINDLKTVTSINSSSVVIATHSPDIISDNWDLRVELQGVE